MHAEGNMLWFNAEGMPSVTWGIRGEPHPQFADVVELPVRVADHNHFDSWVLQADLQQTSACTPSRSRLSEGQTGLHLRCYTNL